MPEQVCAYKKASECLVGKDSKAIIGTNNRVTDALYPTIKVIAQNVSHVDLNYTIAVGPDCAIVKYVASWRETSEPLNTQE